MTTGRSSPPESAVDGIAEQYLEGTTALNPLLATMIGITGHDRELPDLSPDGCQSRVDLARATLNRLDGAERGTGGGAMSVSDRVTTAAMRERLGLELELAAAGEDLRNLNVIESPMQSLRDVFDLMPTAAESDWSDVTARLAGLPAAVAGYRQSLERARTHGNIAARRQVGQVAEQCEDFGGPDGFFRAFARDARIDGVELPASLAADVARAADAAAAAYLGFADYLRAELLPDAPADDAVGRERYALFSRYFLGAEVDLESAYEWGLAELARIEAEMADVSRQIVGTGGVAAAMAALDADPARVLHGTVAFREWMQELSDRTLAELDGTHFDIPEPIRALDCRIAPTHTGGIYYTQPSEDFSRPGTMWWSVPTGVDTFNTWREVTTVFHEGVPGHHLQCGQAVYLSGQLNRWRRLLCWVSGHGEGWALYAERLMAELGHLDDPGARLGMLDSQAFRAARVVVDIGVHLRLPVPPELGRGPWDAAGAWTYLGTHAGLDEKTRRFELDRYLGWPGQAPSYKIGERIWLELRAQVQAIQGASFELRDFHRRALDIGSVGLDVLQQVLVEAVSTS